MYFPYNWQNIRFYSISTDTLPAGRYKIIISYTALNYDQYPGLSNPAALAFVADISASSAVTPMAVFNQTQGTFYPTIPSAVADAHNNDVLLVLPGTINQSTQVVINIPLTLQGLPGSRIVLTADTILFLVVGNNITLENLTITSDVPKEFIQIGGNNNRILNNTIFGPPQQLPMINWVVNRAVVPQANNANNLIVKGNNFHSLRTGMYLNPGTNGNITNNVVFNTKGGFLVDNASFVLQGNSWDNPANEFDIVLFASTPCNSPLYDPTTTLSANNNGATISDQRVCS
ncbi:right-handed parallel beta-helix repeat-containing protein [Aneurinibacillus sp. Ricciae_BoGa-3]|uniref:right-handed parallel beta-helix repeat-containing protein n=1 Tax=Aneurinibacillus sp. Ricciae_BoGa-3 TaxID=3022697 RepID=UPI00233FA929|nr:right-handed parallel beta-helix repeat-containing protein [Aneurinibacillus sp. Ricciae_BoGa-3]WCK56778.1 right-handed parallel beta-helix repeat-containing protein [Aneurinibacillus sp. Ricciae_BoGa-3]